MISLIVPTYNEARNIPKLIPFLYNNLKKTGQDFEILIMDDDSPDKTWEIASRYSKYNVRVIRRFKDKGLSNAVIDGFRKSRGDILGVIDADLSHPPALLPDMIREAKTNDIVIASRYVVSGYTEFSLFRKIVSYVATMLARPLTPVRDPMSGYFVFKKKILRNADLKPLGYKILLEMLVKCKYSSVKEVPFVFAKRYRGKSKLGFKVYANYIRHVLSLYAYSLFRNI